MDFPTEGIVNWLESAIRLATPLIIAATGGLFVERSGVLNIGIEGMMLFGAFAAVAGSFLTGNVLLAALMAMVVGGLLGLLHAYLTVTRRADQIVSGAAINLLALGATDLLNRRLFLEGRPRVALFPVIGPESMRDIPIAGPLVFDQPVIVWIAMLLSIFLSILLYRTTIGLHLRSAGEHSKALRSAGHSVVRLRYFGVLMSGIFAGLGGAALSLGAVGIFTPNMTNGRGFVVLAAFVAGKWNPMLVAIACLVFGMADALQLQAQAVGMGIPYQFLIMLPYLLTVAALAGLVGRTTTPKELGKPYDPQDV
jgi:simple sugar transport system permease protein